MQFNLKYKFPIPSSVFAYSPDGEYVACAEPKTDPNNYYPFVNIHKTTTGEVVDVFRVDTSTKPISCLAYSTDGKILACGSQDGRIYLHKGPKTGNIFTITNAPDLPVRKLTFSPDGKFLAGCNSAYIYIWRVNGCRLDYAERITMCKPDASLTNIIFSPNGKMLALGVNDGLSANDLTYIYRISLNTENIEKSIFSVTHTGMEGVHNIILEDDGSMLVTRPVTIDRFSPKNTDTTGVRLLLSSDDRLCFKRMLKVGSNYVLSSRSGRMYTLDSSFKLQDALYFGSTDDMHISYYETCTVLLTYCAGNVYVWHVSNYEQKQVEPQANTPIEQKQPILPAVPSNSDSETEIKALKTMIQTLNALLPSVRLEHASPIMEKLLELQETLKAKKETVPNTSLASLVAPIPDNATVSITRGEWERLLAKARKE